MSIEEVASTTNNNPRDMTEQSVRTDGVEGQQNNSSNKLASIDEIKRLDQQQESLADMQDNLADKQDTLASKQDTLASKQDNLETMLKTVLEQNEIILKTMTGKGDKTATTDTNATTTKTKEKDDKHQTLRAAFAKDVDAYCGGRTTDPKVKYEKWKDDVATFYSVYKPSIPDDKFMIDLIELKIKDEAKTWFLENKEKFKSYEDVFNGIEKRFGPANPLWEFYDRMKRFDTAGKSMREIGAEFSTIVKTAPNYVPQSTFQMAFYYIIPSRIKGLLLNSKPDKNATWSELLELAANLELATDEDNRKRSTLEGRIGKPAPAKKRKITCYRCKKDGHFSNQCPERRKPYSKKD